MSSSSPWGGGGVRALGGPGPTAVELADLAHASSALRAAQESLERAGAHVRVAAAAERARTNPLAPSDGPAFALARADRLVRDAAGTGSGVGSLRRRLGRVVTYYDEAESWVSRVMRSVVTFDAQVLGEAPVLLPLAGPVLAPAAVGAGAGAALTVARGGGPLAEASARQVPSEAVDPVAGFLRSSLPGVQAPVPDPLRTLAGEAAGDPGPSVLVPRADPPELPAPRSAGDVLRNVAASYPPGHGGRPGTPHSTISVQRLTHPDGGHAWVVEIPGTQSGAFGGAVATDMTTNARLIAGLPDDMSTGVLHALRDAGVRSDEPILLAGHSQGGMVAVTAAALAAGAYDVRAVLTAGSPDVPRRAPAGVQVRHYRIDEDLVPQSDGRPDAVGRDVVVVRRRLRARGVAGSHALDQYVRTAELADAELAGSPALRGFDAELARVLGPPGTTAQTWQFSVTRDPAVVAVDPATGRRRVPVARPADVSGP
ncbi:MAG: hypothetical protein AAGC49_02380 [Brevundimonas sp.]